jgi:MFS family permease
MEQTAFKVYKYRWIMLSVYMLAIIVNQLLWITFAPVTKAAAEYYHVTDLQIGLLSMSFMVVFIFFSIPASWAIDTYGLKFGVGIGTLLTGLFGMMRGLVADNYTLLLIAQIGIAVGQPFLLNAITKLAARWFPLSERATAAGLGTLAMYVGVLAGMLITPYLTNRYGLIQMVYIYGIVSVIVAFIFILFAKERPKTAPCHAHEEVRSLVWDGLRDTLKNRNFYWLLLIFFVGLGIFNSVTTWIEDILRPRGFSAEQAGYAGGMMIMGGILGALIMPILSDKYRKRKLFIIIALGGCIAGLTGITFATNYSLLLTSGFVLGFFLLSAGPIGFQYGAEITYPASEETSNGLMILAGQISGIAFIFGMDIFKDPVTKSMTQPLLVMIGLSVLILLSTVKLKESPFMTNTEIPKP